MKNLFCSCFGFILFIFLSIFGCVTSENSSVSYDGFELMSKEEIASIGIFESDDIRSVLLPADENCYFVGFEGDKFLLSRKILAIVSCNYHEESVSKLEFDELVSLYRPKGYCTEVVSTVNETAFFYSCTKETGVEGVLIVLNGVYTYSINVRPSEEGDKEKLEKIFENIRGKVLFS